MRADSSSHRWLTKYRRGFSLFLGLVMIAVGLLLLSGVGAYYGLGLYSSTQLHKLNASFEGPPSLPPAPAASLVGASQDAVAPLGSPALNGASVPPLRSSLLDAESPSNAGPSLPVLSLSSHLVAAGDKLEPAAEAVPFPVSTYESVYPASNMHPKYWHQPMWAGTDVYTAVDTSPTAGFKPIAASDWAEKGARAGAQRMIIPIIGVDSAVSELAILDLGDSRAYETPDRVVGHIPSSANPGEAGNGWFFGHLESFVRGEGNVFNRLPDVAEHLTNGDPVYVSVLSDKGEYLYQVVESEVLHRDELHLYDTEDSTITLVTCSNRPHYDYRQLVTAKLVGFRPLSTLN